MHIRRIDILKFKMTPVYVFCIVLMVMGLILAIIGLLNIINYWINSDDIPEGECWKYRFILIGNIVVLIIGIASMIFAGYLLRNSWSLNTSSVLSTSKISESNTKNSQVVMDPAMAMAMMNGDYTFQFKDASQEIKKNQRLVNEYERYIVRNAEMVRKLHDKVYDNLDKYLNISKDKYNNPNIEEIKSNDFEIQKIAKEANQNSAKAASIVSFAESVGSQPGSEAMAIQYEKINELAEDNYKLVIASGQLVKSSEKCLNNINEIISRQLSR